MLGNVTVTKYMYIKHHKLLHSNIIKKKNNTSVKTRTPPSQTVCSTEIHS